MITKETIGKKLREIRGSRSVKQVAEKAGVTPSTIYSYERGQNLPDVITLKKIATYFKCKVDDFLI